ncbi:glycoside hydrolase family 2 protein [Chenggangzhangella methanolivorans]|uniref:Glycoside hydrolase family 2 protein n=1 Tax=Chenggangzhangella methanolivorans TaxID=1437009 RepID=A0A9E6UQU7_9HYPH|nr:glycoside hydrolase family 2 protein [Chenggangzhangella methanolivorans]QZO01505.1 glycoside hydrolase family 2 protein [Chenggangzhangella methanolivorans]
MASFRTSHRAPIDGWSVLATAADAHASPADLPDAGWAPFEVPGTIAGALRAQKALTDASAHAIDAKDHWLRTRLSEPLSGSLVFDGLAIVSEIWIDGEKRAESRSMFEPVTLDVDLAAGAEVAICFRALGPRLAAAPKRSRWRPQMIQPNGLRFFRTTALGSTPGWSPAGRPTGPWRPIWRVEGAMPKIDVRTAYEDGVGRLKVTLKPRPSCPAAAGHPRLSGSVERDDQVVDTRAKLGHDGVVRCAGLTAPLVQEENGRLVADLALPGVAPWFPHTHGEPALHDLSVTLDGETFDLGRVGFRSIAVDRDADGDGFGLVINGVPVFARGACWSSADAVSLAGSREAYKPWLRLAREAGMNMIRVPGVMAYETDDFFALCDELGIMVWQEAMLANFDYPQADEAFRESVRREAESFLDRTQTNACLAVFCGGSEVFQQAAMLGAPADAWGGPVFDEALPEALKELRPDVPYVPNSPSGGHLPFIADQGVTHYYGVGAYRRPLEDARRARVRFASESLAFSNVPEDVSLARAKISPVTHTPDWKRGVPRDMGAAWDFEDVRDHYVERLYGVSTLELKREDPERYFALSRAVVPDVLEEAYAEFRRPGSATRGALVWLLQDLMPGAGWGVIASDGEPKSAWHGLKRAFRPVQLSITDEGVNGIALHVINERPEPLEAELSLTCWRDGAAPVVAASRAVAVASREAQTLSAFELIGRFFDISYAYKFGPPSHDVTSAALTCARTGAVLAEAFHFPLGRARPRAALGLSARVEGEPDAPELVLKSERFAQSVHISDEAWRPAENWLHLAPGREKRIALVARKEGTGAPGGVVRALNSLDEATY